MKISFQDVLPEPIRHFAHDQQSVWNSGFTLEFPKNVLLNARSGKGKSTFVQLLNGLRNDYSGEIRLNDRPIATLTLDEWIVLRREHISTIFQDLQLFPRMSAFENLMIKNKLTSHRTEIEVLDYMEKLGISAYKDQKCGTLSLGQQQRVAIIRALLQPFEVLLMDEPFSHLDEENTKLALELIQTEVKRNEAGMILTSLGDHHGMEYDIELKL